VCVCENDNILDELKVDEVEKKVAQYKEMRLNHVSRMEGIRYPRRLLDYRPMGTRPGRLLKRRLN